MVFEKDFFLPFNSFTLSFLFLIMLLNARRDISDFLNLFKIWLFIFIFLYYQLCWFFIAVCGLPPVVVPGPLIAVASLVLNPGVCGTWASVVSAHRLSCSVACGISQTGESNLCPLPWQMDSLTTVSQEEPWLLDFIVCFFKNKILNLE